MSKLGVVVFGVLSAASIQTFAHECLIEPNRTAEIRSPVAGIVVNVAVNRGDTVKAGQVVVELDSTVEKAALEVAKYRAEMTGPVIAAKNRVEFARKKVARLNNLEGKSFVSAQQRDEAQAEERLAESELTAATEEKQLARVEYKRAAALLEQRVLRSPFNGFVAERNMNPGELADQNASSKAILKLSELDPLKIEVTLSMDLFGQVNAGTPMQIKTEGGVVLNQVTVSSVDKEIDPKSGTFRAHITIPNPKNAIASGPRCEASLDAKARSP